MSVNDVNVVNVSHSVAVEALKRAGNRVELKVKRKRAGITSGEDGPNSFIEVELFKVSESIQSDLSPIPIIIFHNCMKKNFRKVLQNISKRFFGKFISQQILA